MRDLTTFLWDRLDLAPHADIGGRVPSLDEDWFVEDALAAGSAFVWRGRDAETSHRLLYRYARTEALRQGRPGGAPHWLLLHQMTVLVPCLAAGAEKAVADGHI